jgi:hypothetical protein
MDSIQDSTNPPSVHSQIGPSDPTGTAEGQGSAVFRYRPHNSHNIISESEKRYPKHRRDCEFSFIRRDLFRIECLNGLVCKLKQLLRL